MPSAAESQLADRAGTRSLVLLGVRAILSLTVPLAVGLALGDLHGSFPASIGALCATLIFLKTKDQPLKVRHFGAILFGASGYSLGALLSGVGSIVFVLPVVLAIVAGIVHTQGGLRQLTSTHLVMYSILGASFTQRAGEPPWLVMLLFLAGAGWASLMTLVFKRVFEHEKPVHEDSPIFTVQFKPSQGFNPEREPLAFGFLLASALVLADIAAFLLHPERPYWIPLTVVIVLRPSASLSWSRGVDRVGGTTIGVVLAVAAMSLIHSHLALSIVLAMCAFALPLAMTQGYFVQSVCTTAIAMFYFDALGLREKDLFEARVLDTIIGSAIVVIVLVVERLIWGDWRLRVNNLRTGQRHLQHAQPG